MGTTCPGTVGCYIDTTPGGSATWLPPVATFAALPTPPATGDGSVAVVLDTNILWQWDATTVTWIPVAAFGSTLTYPGNPDTHLFGYLGQQCLDTTHNFMYVNTSNPNGNRWKRT